jgi:Protein of unknown function (DUF2958)
MKLLTTEILERLPPLGSQEERGLDALAVVKFFFPDFHWTWYASEFDGEDTFFGYVVGDVPELGYFSLAELTSARGKLGLPVERDRFFEPTPLRELIAKHEGTEALSGSNQ